MESSRLSFKLFLQQEPAAIRFEELVPVFHSWIQQRAIKDHLLIDVADYSHVHDGPGIVLVSHEANYSLDSRGGKAGLTYQRKQPLAGSFNTRLRAALRSTVEAAVLLEDRFPFRTDQIEFRICDRLHAPNTGETFGVVKSDLLNLVPVPELDHRPSAAELFTVMIRPKDALPLKDLLARLAA